MSGGGENEDRVQKGKALRFTGSTSQITNHVAAHIFKMDIFFYTNVKLLRNLLKSVCKDAQKHHPQRGSLFFFALFSFNWNGRQQFCDVICFSISKIAYKHVCACI